MNRVEKSNFRELGKRLRRFSSFRQGGDESSCKRSFKRIHGPVSRLIEVPKQYAVAIETALAASMQHIVVGNEQDAKQAILF